MPSPPSSQATRALPFLKTSRYRGSGDSPQNGETRAQPGFPSPTQVLGFRVSGLGFRVSILQGAHRNSDVDLAQVFSDATMNLGWDTSIFFVLKS